VKKADSAVFDGSVGETPRFVLVSEANEGSEERALPALGVRSAEPVLNLLDGCNVQT